MFGTILGVMIAGFFTGGLARLAVPGPDPMPVWLTIAIGLAGSIAGGAVAIAIWGRDATTAASLLGFGAAILLVVAYRRFYQGRSITGPDAQKFPDRGIGIGRLKERQQQAADLFKRHQHAAETPTGGDVTEQLGKLGELRDQGVLTDEEFEAKKAELLSRL